MLSQEFDRVLERRRELRENVSRGFFFIDGADSRLMVTAIPSGSGPHGVCYGERGVTRLIVVAITV